MGKDSQKLLDLGEAAEGEVLPVDLDVDNIAMVRPVLGNIAIRILRTI
jgi:hypothetical protein